MADGKSMGVVFENPPVIETVLGVQFVPLQRLTGSHVGWFWKTALDNSWPKVAEVGALLPQYELFGETTFSPPVQLRIEPMRFPGRVQISQENDGRMIQIQPNRFHYNWNRIGGDYPHFRVVHEEFNCYFNAFTRFVAEAGLGEVIPDQWEVTYIDSIAQGPLWTTPAGWHRVLPGLLSAREAAGSCRLESVGGEWHFEIPPQRGRLHISVQLARVGNDPTPVLLLQTTVRGPIGRDATASLGEGLELGHQAALDSFVDITSEEAHNYWRRKS